MAAAAAADAADAAAVREGRDVNPATLQRAGPRTVRAAVVVRVSSPHYVDALLKAGRWEDVVEAAAVERDDSLVDACLRQHRPVEGAAAMDRLFERHDWLPPVTPELAKWFKAHVEAHVIPACAKDPRPERVSLLAAHVRSGMTFVGLRRLMHAIRSLDLFEAYFHAHDRVSVERHVVASLNNSQTTYGVDLLLRLAESDPSVVARLIDQPGRIHTVRGAVQRDLLTRAGADPNQCHALYHYTLLNNAICHHDDPLIDVLLNQRAGDLDPNVTTAGSCFPFVNGCLGNAVRLRRFDLVPRLLALPRPATCGVSVTQFHSVGMLHALLLQDAAMPFDVFQALMPMAGLEQDAIRNGTLAVVADCAPKVAAVLRRYGAPIDVITTALANTATPRVLAEAIAQSRSFDPCALDYRGESAFRVLHKRLTTQMRDHAITETTFHLIALEPGTLMELTNLDTIREEICERVVDLVNTWRVIEHLSRPLPVDHPDAITRFTGLGVEEYVRLAWTNDGGQALSTAAVQSLRAFRRWCSVSQGRASDLEKRFRLVGLVWAYRVLRRPAWLLRHRVRVLGRGKGRLDALRAALGGIEPEDHVTGMPVEAEAAHRCRVFSPAKVWAPSTGSPPPRFCVDLASYAQLMATRDESLRSTGAIINGVRYNRATCDHLATQYIALKARVETAREEWVDLPSPEHLQSMHEPLMLL